MKKLLFGTLLLALVISIPLPSMAGVDISIGIALPPPIVFEAPPDVVVLPDTNDVYVAPNAGVDLFFWNGWWWRPWEGGWYRSRYYNRGWGYYNRVPSFYYDVDPHWRQYYRDRDWQGHPWNYQRIPDRELQHNWRGWHNDRYWERQRSWGVQDYHPRTIQQRRDIRYQRQQQYQRRPEVVRHQQIIRERQGQPQGQRFQRQPQQGHPQGQKFQRQPQGQPQGQRFQRQPQQGHPQGQKFQRQPQGQPQGRAQGQQKRENNSRGHSQGQ